jgi:hypothetical protein
MKKWIITAAVATSLFQHCLAQKVNRNDFKKVDAYVASLGPMEGSFLKIIVDTLTHRQTIPRMDQVRAMYMWEANYIDYNTKGRRHPKNFNPSPSEALANRMTTDEGYANLFKTMCDLAHIDSKVIEGMAKTDPRNIGGKLSNKWNKHFWNAVNIDGTWYLLDVAWSAGKTDRKFRFYTKSFTDAWFLTDRELFAMSHYPNDKKWQLLDTPINKSVFSGAPIVGTSAIINEVYPVSGKRGNIRGKADTTKQLIFEVGNPSLIKSVTVTGRTMDRIPAKYNIQDGLMYVDVPFKSEGDYPFNIYVNDVMAYTYKADVGKAKKKPKPKPEPKPKPKPKPRPEPKRTAPAKKDIEKKKETKQKSSKHKEKTKEETPPENKDTKPAE